MYDNEMKSPFYNLEEWFSYSSIIHYRDDVCYWIVFKNCQLKQDIAQFKKDTMFTFIKFNENGVIKFNIYDKNRPGLFEEPGYNYLGRWLINIDNNIYTSLLGYWGFCYGQTEKAIEGGFRLRNCKAHERTPKLFKNEFIDELRLRFDKNTLDINEHHLNFQIKLILLPESIRTSYLESELEKRHITEHEYNDTKSRRKSFKFDVELPEHI